MTPYKALIIITALAICQTSCSKKQDQYKEGETVTWKFNDELIIKAKVGERRKHIKDTHCPKCERASYQPEYEHYLGQFPIEYQPESFKKLTVAEAEALPYGKSLEFNLMLNGSWVEATDKDVVSENALDHEDQVKVKVRFEPFTISTKEGNLISLKEVQGIPNEVISKRYNLQCRDEELGLSCFGQSTNKAVSGIIFTFWNNDKVKATYYEPIYGGIRVNWYAHRKNLQHWQEIDAGIWHLLNSWNVSSVQSN